MLTSFAPAVSNFYSSAVTWMADVPVLGTGVMISDEGRGRRRLIDTCISPADAVFGVDADGMADELIVERWLNPVQAARYYGADALPPKLRERAASGKTDARTRFLQAIQPNDDYTPAGWAPRGCPLFPPMSAKTAWPWCGSRATTNSPSPSRVGMSMARTHGARPWLSYAGIGPQAAGDEPRQHWPRGRWPRGRRSAPRACARCRPT
ncbi:hypothetical protein MASR1M32_10520 [Rhodobacter sp.]